MQVDDDRATIDFDSEEGAIYALAAQIQFPGDMKRYDEYRLVVFQTNESNETLSGATVIYRVA